jgi:drug/metabolite transporter (DMT)-like permease
LLGILYAALGAFTFALNNVMMRRGVVTGSVMQGMALTVPFGGLTFLVIAMALGEMGQIVMFPAIALAWLAGQGIVHFVFGRYCNYKSNQLMGVNLAAPVVQLQVPVAMLLAVLTLHEKFTVLQALGSVLMLGGSFVTQSNAGSGARVSAPARTTPSETMPGQTMTGQTMTGQTTPGQTIPAPNPAPVFRPRVFSGYVFALGAAVCYGASPLMAREGFLHAPGAGTAAGGCLAYAAATLFFSLFLFKRGAWRDIMGTSRENLSWFLAAAVLVAISQAFVYASLAAAPLMVVTPILQLSLVFRLMLSQSINREHEIMNLAVVIGAFIAVLGSLLVSLDTDQLAGWFGLPNATADFLRYRLAGG